MCNIEEKGLFLFFLDNFSKIEKFCVLPVKLEMIEEKNKHYWSYTELYLNVQI